MRVVLLDNRDSFVYNLVDQFASLGADIEVWRNTVPAAAVLVALEPSAAEAARGERPVLCLSTFDVVLEFATELSIVIDSAEAIIDLGGGEDKAVFLAVSDYLFEEVFLLCH